MSVLGLFMLCVIITVTVSSGDVINVGKVDVNSCDTENYKSKVVFEGMEEAENESKEEAVKKVKEASKDAKTSIWIEVESDFEGLEKPSDDVSKSCIDIRSNCGIDAEELVIKVASGKCIIYFDGVCKKNRQICSEFWF